MLGSIRKRDHLINDLPPKKWTQLRVGSSMNASSKHGGVQWQGKKVKRSDLTGISRSLRSRWSQRGGHKAAEVARSLGIHQNQLGIFVRLVLRKTNPAVNALEGNSLSLSVTARNL